MSTADAIAYDIYLDNSHIEALVNLNRHTV